MAKDAKRYELKIPVELHTRLVELAVESRQSLHSYLLTVLEAHAGTGRTGPVQAGYSTRTAR